MKHSILIVDDEKDIIDMLKDYFEINNYIVMTAMNGTEAIKKASLNPHIILLDVNMPDIDGLQVCERIRDFVTCPIIFLTARIEDRDKIRAFSIGGDDYVVKPFSLEELGARIGAHLRREHRQKNVSNIKFDEKVTIDYAQRCIYVMKEPLKMAKKEFEIVELLSTHPGQIFDKERIYEIIWGIDGDGESSVVAEHIRRIRMKFMEAKARNFIDTVWGVGYKWIK